MAGDGTISAVRIATTLQMFVPVLVSCGDDGVRHIPDAAPTCPAPGAELVHSTAITADETWAGDGTIHHVTTSFNVMPGATLTLAACAIVHVDAGESITINATAAMPAKLVALGTVDQPVVVTATDPTQPWGFLRGYTDGSSLELAYTTLEKAGSGTYHGASIHLRGPGDPMVSPMLKADHLTVTGSAGTGVVLEAGAAFTADSTQLTVTNGGSVMNDSAIEISPMPVGTLPMVDATGNVRDQIRVVASPLAIPASLTIHKRVPYYFVFDRVRVFSTNGPPPTLTIEAGTELRFDDYIEIGEQTAGVAGHPAVLLAVGTPADPIIFTSSKATQAAGDWPGIFMPNSAGSQLSNVKIRYAGGNNGIVSANCKPAGSSDHAAIFIGANTANTYIPAAGDFSAVDITDSASHGINAMWSAATFGPDITAGFTFTNIVGCRQTKNGITSGCGAMAGCLVP
jgi:hypothetical protein